MDLGAVDSAIEEEDLPGVYCPECTSLRYAGEPSCSTCLAVRPEGGWKPLEEADDPYLGCVVDGRYLITKREASGGSAVVYRAQSIRGDHVAALKIARFGETASMDESRVRERMSREVGAVQMLQNQHIVPIYEFLELDGGAAAIVMEHVTGQTAEEVLGEQGPFAVERALHVARQVARGLAEAHRSDLVHRDIKPSNVMIEEGDENRAYILDFGIVRLQAATRSTQGFLGTPLYASPEQIRMKSLDARTDVYSLGATLHTLLAGAPPFWDEEMMEVMRAHLEAPVPSIETERGAPVPTDLEDLVARMMAKDADERPEDLRRVARELEAIRERASASSDDWATADPASTARGFRAPHLSSGPDAEDGEEGAPETVRRNPLGHVGEIGSSASSGEFTPGAAGTAEFGTLPSDTDEVQTVDEAGAGETQPGLQPPSDQFEHRRLAAENSIEFRPDTAGGEGSVPELFHTRTGERFVVVDDATGDVRVVDRTGSTSSTRLRSFDDQVTAVAVGEAHAWIGFADGRVERLHLEDGSSHRVVIASEAAEITDIAVTSDERSVAVATDAGELLYRHEDLGAGWERSQATAAIDALAMNDRGDCLVLARADGTLETRRPDETSGETASFESEQGIRSLTIADSGDVVGALYGDGAVRVLHASTGREVVELPEFDSRILSLFFDNDGDLHGVEREGSDWRVRDLADDRVVEEVSETVSVEQH